MDPSLPRTSPRSYFSTLTLLRMITSLILLSSRQGATAFRAATSFAARRSAALVVKPTTTTTTARPMCGLVAVVSDVWNAKQSSSSSSSGGIDYHALFHQDILHRTTAMLDHRGPDGMVVHTDTGRNWGLGHTRLAIVDPENSQADMPFRLNFNDSKGTIHLAANGEIYNHNALYQQMRDQDGWTADRVSGSDCEVIAHAYAKYGGPTAVTKLDGMFAFVLLQEDEETGEIKHAFAARDPVGIKPLYYGTKDGHYVFSSELKALVGHVDPETVVAVPAGHYWTPETGLVCYYNPEWLRDPNYAPWKDPNHQVTDDEIRTAFTKAVQKRMMADVEYGFFLSGGVDSCIVSHVLLPLYRKEREAAGNFKPINTYTVGMANSPDVMAAKGMVEALGGSKYITHHVREFTPDEVFELIPKIVYHMETYEAELIRSSIPNYLLAERASQDVKMVLTGEGADELFAGYLYFQDAESPEQVQEELCRIYNMLGHINLHRTDRMTMAHSLEARVPFLDTEFTRLVMSVDPAKKVVDPEAVKTNSRGREKTFLRELFEGPNENGHYIPKPVLWRAKAMQCEGVGEDWVSILQQKISALVTDEEMEEAPTKYPLNTPQTKEELYYRRIFDEHFHGMEHVVKLWEGGGRAMGAAWKSDMYTREGLKNPNLLKHALQKNNDSSAFSSDSANHEFLTTAQAAGYNEFEGLLTAGGDCRTIINEETKTNKYHIRPQPIGENDIFRGSCTGNPPTARGYAAAQKLYEEAFVGKSHKEISESLRKVFADQRARIAKVLDLPDDSEIILCPSGSDAEYLPLAIARTLRPDAKISVGVAQLKEVGAGTAPAAEGKYFSTHAPLLGKLPENSEFLSGLDDITSTIFTAREKDGSAVNAAEKMQEFLKESLAKGDYPITHGVFGGKTGLRCETMPASIDGGMKSLGVVDACQGRFSKAELKEWLDQESLVLFTGSKFYQAPPFAGAVIIPGSIAQKLRESPAKELADVCSATGLGGFLTDKEVPESFAGWNAHLAAQESNNVGLALRWEAGLAAMEALASASDEEMDAAVEEWAAGVQSLVSEQPLLDVWCVERSIVSLRISNNKGGWLNMSELRELFGWMSADLSHLVPGATAEEKEALKTTAYTGQPVDVSESHGIIRLALGAECMLDLLDKNKKIEHSKRDALAVKKMAALAKHFTTIKEKLALEQTSKSIEEAVFENASAQNATLVK